MTDWRQHAECRGEDPELFFPIGSETAAQDYTRQAKQVCACCPVIAECRNWAMTGEDHGVWGGLSADERRAQRRALLSLESVEAGA